MCDWCITIYINFRQITWLKTRQKQEVERSLFEPTKDCKLLLRGGNNTRRVKMSAFTAVLLIFSKN